MIKQTSIPVYIATIYVGPRYDSATEPVCDRQGIENILQVYTEETGVCVALFADAQYIYNGAGESGFVIGMIHTDVGGVSVISPALREEIRGKALELAQRIFLYAPQMKVSVVFPDDIVMLTNDEA